MSEINFKIVEKKRKLTDLNQVKFAYLCWIPYNTYAKYTNGKLKLWMEEERTKAIIRTLNTYLKYEAEIREEELMELLQIEIWDILLNE